MVGEGTAFAHSINGHSILRRCIHHTGAGCSLAIPVCRTVRSPNPCLSHAEPQRSIHTPARLRYCQATERLAPVPLQHLMMAGSSFGLGRTVTSQKAARLTHTTAWLLFPRKQGNHLVFTTWTCQPIRALVGHEFRLCSESQGKAGHQRYARSRSRQAQAPESSDCLGAFTKRSNRLRAADWLKSILLRGWATALLSPTQVLSLATNTFGYFAGLSIA